MARYRLRYEGFTKAAWTFFIEGDNRPLWLSQKHVPMTGNPLVGNYYAVEIPDYIADHHKRLAQARIGGLNTRSKPSRTTERESDWIGEPKPYPDAAPWE